MARGYGLSRSGEAPAHDSPGAPFRPRRNLALRAMPIERFVWTLHAEQKRAERLLDRVGVERAVRNGHPNRQINRGRADWLIHGLLVDGRRVEVVYDYPYGADHAAALIVSVWDL
jgi:hypothetical protein